jgi:hypothetical protein
MMSRAMVITVARLDGASRGISRTLRKRVMRVLWLFRGSCVVAPVCVD